MYVPRASRIAAVSDVPADQHYNGRYLLWRSSLEGREAGAISNQEEAAGDDDADDERYSIGIVPPMALEIQRCPRPRTQLQQSRVSVTRQVRRSQSQLPPERLSARTMSGQRGSADDLDLEIESRRRRRRSVYYAHQRAGPSQSAQAIPPIPTRKEILSRNEYWQALDGEKSPSSTATGHSEASSRLQRVREKLKWQSLRGIFSRG